MGIKVPLRTYILNTHNVPLGAPNDSSAKSGGYRLIGIFYNLKTANPEYRQIAAKMDIRYKFKNGQGGESGNQVVGKSRPPRKLGGAP